MGNQCGCGTRGFQPSHSIWVYDNDTINSTTFLGVRHNPGNTNRTKSSNPVQLHPYLGSATIRLAQRTSKANATLCFAGDSIDLQFYRAIENNLRRLIQLQQLQDTNTPFNIYLTTSNVAVNHTTKPGSIRAGHRPSAEDPYHGFRLMDVIEETMVYMDEDSVEGRGLRVGRFRYYKFYGWSPWNVEFMEECNIVIMNLGLHYWSSGQNIGIGNKNRLIDDVRAAITYLSNFTASKENRIAIWRSALPQHFDTRDGHFHPQQKHLLKNKSCTAIKYTVGGSGKMQVQQEYNKVYDEAFSIMCNSQQQQQLNITMLEHSCGHLKHICTVNLTSMDFLTVYRFWVINNCTDSLGMFKMANNDGLPTNPLVDTQNSTVTGTILRWNIFDLFDVPMWHTDDLDCSHFGYIPQLYEAAFDRLELLLSEFMSL